MEIPVGQLLSLHFVLPNWLWLVLWHRFADGRQVLTGEFITARQLEASGVNHQLVANIEVIDRQVGIRVVMGWDDVTTNKSALRCARVGGTWFRNVDGIIFQVEVDIESFVER